MSLREFFEWLGGSSERPLFFGGEWRALKRERREHKALRKGEKRERRLDKKELKELGKDLREEQRSIHLIQKLLKYLRRLEGTLVVTSSDPEVRARADQRAEEFRKLVLKFSQRLTDRLSEIVLEKENEERLEEQEQSLDAAEASEESNVVRFERKAERGVIADVEQAEEAQDRKLAKLALWKRKLESWKEGLDRQEEAILKRSEAELLAVIKEFQNSKRNTLLEVTRKYAHVLEPLEQELLLFRTKDVLQRARTKREVKAEKEASHELKEEQKADAETMTLEKAA